MTELFADDYIKGLEEENKRLKEIIKRLSDELNGRTI
jgi:hypothetical protein